MSDDQDGCECVSFFWYRPTRVVPDQRPLNGCVCVCVCVCVCAFSNLNARRIPICLVCKLTSTAAAAADNSAPLRVPLTARERQKERGELGDAERKGMVLFSCQRVP